jgi:OHCU decarboxylase
MRGATRERRTAPFRTKQHTGERTVRFNALTRQEAERELYASFASRARASRVAVRRPYADFAALLETADSVWSEPAPADWLEVATHPRIGERGGHSPSWSEREQHGVRRARAATFSALAKENRRYEARFGHVFLISATGRSADDMLAALRQRPRNDLLTHIWMAAEEHLKITRLRFERPLRA